jgi:serine/threonine protein kinase
MTPERYARVCELFDQAGQLDPPSRDTFLDQACGNDTSLRLEVEQMLAADRSAPAADYLAAPLPLNLRSLLPTCPADGDVGRRIGPYQVERILGQGGMGSVYLAQRVDDFRHRVALKIIKRGLDTDELVQRFRLERQVLAGLAHPHIARLLDGGTTYDGLPFFVMEYIDGSPIDRYCDSHRLTARKRAQLVRDICGAVDHAHRQGIIHRDLKPGNVLVGPDGCPKVTDFGLAKRFLSEPEALPGESGASATGVAPAAHTQSGAILGTPSYMAPEQAGSQSQAIGPATDVYALGAILYELLTGRPPFKADTPLDTVLQVLQDDPVSPTRLQPTLPRDLETITLKCLQKDPARRYATAAALADDLDRFLRDEPIRARPVSRVERVYRWCRRNPKVAGLAAALVVVLITGFTVITALWLEAERRGQALAQETEESRRQRERAEKNFDRVFRTIEDALAQVRSKELQKPQMRALRKQLLAAPLLQCRGIIDELGDKPWAARRLALAYLKLAQINYQTGDRDEARAAATQGVDLAERLLRQDPQSIPAQELAASAHEQLGVAAADRAEAERAVSRSRHLLEQLLHDHPARAAGYRSHLAYTYHNVGDGEGAAGRLAEALHWMARARAIREEQVAAAKTWGDVHSHLAQLCVQMAVIQRQLNQYAAARVSARRAIELYAGLADRLPDEARHEIALSEAYLELSNLQDQTERPADAVTTLQKACARLEQLVARPWPEGTDLIPAQMALARAYNNLGVQLGVTYFQPTLARQTWQKAHDLQDKLIVVRPGDRELRYLLGVACYNLAERTKLSAKPDDLLALYQQACRHLERVVREAPHELTYHKQLTQALEDTAKELRRRGRRADAAAAFQQAVVHQRIVYQSNPQDSAARKLLVQFYEALARLRRDLGQPAQAAAVARERGQVFANDPLQRYQAARDLARCMRLVGQNQRELTTAQEQERHRYGDQALAELRAALAAGFKNLARLRTDSALEPLRPRKDYQALLQAGKDY